MKRLGLIGYPLEHSFSAAYFKEKFQREGISGWRYDLFPIREIERITDLIADIPELAGLNVTIPYKRAVLPFLHELADEAREIGAVNTIKIRQEGNKRSLAGFNTDVYGFEKSLVPLLKPHHNSALILGTGGGSGAVQYVLKKLGIEFSLVSRNPRSGMTGYPELTSDKVSSHKLIINTTPLGMYPEAGACPPIPYEAIGPEHVLYDLVYNPAQTTFLLKGAAQGATIKNGLEMLHLQAEKAWEIWSSE